MSELEAIEASTRAGKERVHHRVRTPDRAVLSLISRWGLRTWPDDPHPRDRLPSREPVLIPQCGRSALETAELSTTCVPCAVPEEKLNRRCYIIGAKDKTRQPRAECVYLAHQPQADHGSSTPVAAPSARSVRRFRCTIRKVSTGRSAAQA
eukprot:3031148-Rhodomonas_salina.1